MFIKLQYTANKTLADILRVAADIINNPSVTSVAALRSRETAANYHPTILANFDDSNSEIIRTVNPSNVKVHVRKAGSLGPDLTFRFAVHDAGAEFTGSITGNVLTVSEVFSGKLSIGQEIITQGVQNQTVITSHLTGSRGGVGTYTVNNSQTVSEQTISTKRFYYIKHTSFSTQMSFNIGDSITGGSIDEVSQFGMNLQNSGTNSIGSNLILGNGYSLSPNLMYNTSTGYTNVRTFWMYITDKGMIWNVTAATTYSNGWGPSYNNTSLQSGPWMFGQYTRYDYFNTDDNGIIPVMFTVPRSHGMGFGNSTEMTQIRNPLFNSNNASIPLKIYNMIQARPQLNSSWPTTYFPNVGYTINGISAGNRALRLRSSFSSTANTIQSGKVITIDSSERYPSADLSSTGFSVSPLGWEHLFEGNHGGNMSDQAGFFIFNGDYQPGDTFGLNNKVWMVWPIYAGFEQRIGIAVPRE